MKQSIKIKWIYGIIPALMLFFFLRHLYLTEKYNLDVWLGGGMRMFAEVDNANYRVIGFYTKVNDSVQFVNLCKSKELYDLSLKARIMPSESRMRELESVLKAKSWCISEGKLQVCSTASEEKKADFRIEKLAVYRMNYETKSKKLKLILITQYIPKKE